MDLNQFAKREIALRYWLQGRGYVRALRALEILKIFEAGELRKDGVTPSTDHMIEIALHISRMPGIRDMETLLVVVLLHDLAEDHGVQIADLERLFGTSAATGIWNMTKKMPILSGGEPVDVSWALPEGDGGTLVLHKGGTKVGMIEREEDELYAAMAACEFASIAKPGDRGHNQKTMVGVFGEAKQLDYVDFTDARILPMMKIARRRFPHQEGAYVILENLLKTQARIVRGILKKAA